MTIADLKQFTDKGKPITYIRAFIELYNCRNHRQVYEIHGIVKFEKICALMVKYPYNFSAHHIIKIYSILHSIHVVSRD